MGDRRASKQIASKTFDFVPRSLATADAADKCSALRANYNVSTLAGVMHTQMQRGAATAYHLQPVAFGSIWQANCPLLPRM
jgi:hypothetical protein